MQQTKFPRIQSLGGYSGAAAVFESNNACASEPTNYAGMMPRDTRRAGLECEMRQETYSGEPAVLSCWKDIAKYLGKGVRTVQRWEREFELPVRRPKGANGKSAVVADPRDLDAWLASRWALRASKETSEPLEARAELIGLKDAIKERIDAARALRAQQGQLIHDLSATMQMLVQNCDLLSKGEALDNMQPAEASRSTRADYAGMDPLSALIERQRRSSDEHRFLMHSANDAI
jgi:hypothetical protein